MPAPRMAISELMGGDWNIEIQISFQGIFVETKKHKKSPGNLFFKS